MGARIEFTSWCVSSCLPFLILARNRTRKVRCGHRHYTHLQASLQNQPAAYEPPLQQAIELSRVVFRCAWPYIVISKGRVRAG